MTKDFFFALFSESESYRSMEAIEEMLDQSGSLVNIPIQPLYVVFKNQQPEKVAELLPRLSKEQRQVFLDLDLWEKDEVDVQQFDFWIQAYSSCPDEKIKTEFVDSEAFALFLKSKFNIWTFDLEEPVYPDHDNYFLTEDNQLLFEFDEEYTHVQEVQNFVKHIYTYKGVENAYTHLFKIVSDAHSHLQEEEYRFQKERMRDVGLVDYFEALEIESPFPNLIMLDHFIKNKKPSIPDIDSFSKNQTVHSSALIAYKDKMNDFTQQLSMVKSQKRVDFLKFNFVRLVNSSLVVSHSLKEGTLAMNRVGQKTRCYMLLGLSYLNDISIPKGDLKLDANESVLEYFDFVEIFRIGLTLVRHLQKNVKKTIREYGFNEDNEYFLGGLINEFLDHFLDSPPKIQANFSERAVEINHIDEFAIAEKLGQTVIDLMPFIYKLYQAFFVLKANGRLQDNFYLNYTVDEIDFEAIIISSFANYYLGHLKQDSAEKLGLTIDECRRFSLWLLDDSGKIDLTKKDVKVKLKEFIKQFGMESVSSVEDFFFAILSKQIEGYDYQELMDQEFKHVGGAILLNSIRQ
ncbi:MAG: hypothetical protein COW00_13390 [Bdellovibrio sp. CG12_big_fil_rev_8_21_14_0_65_39_13]|nr:MAG: hypothetical protein COW78_11440 [Bdellovibrio sp. CG22_combo_CG10-13_8_21_14_all_39_27]PIQ58924.1 MAG: hypothetical protein COW00_13390 [Bdellovibrio sp. CG12_big_fil_rev_8_21_14_0_65_39_13]PIR36013.1 MAG: hypothetical protein COV37_05760 [Bdellovibrio sp. CG11_big_fil_rev_8_21_14_0_20_39_38]PJB54693.1 MAG: hypothetical protein CO099_00125 [Bdellovibrio sp. CG_4_9_14_3_um_filter_39_7]